MVEFFLAMRRGDRSKKDNNALFEVGVQERRKKSVSIHVDHHVHRIPPPVPDGNYWLLDTDYSTFAAVYSCAEGEPVRDSPSTVGWVITREAIPSQVIAIS